MTLIAAMTKDRVIGANNRMLWHIPEDFRHFKRTTLGHAIVMGRKTFESIGGKPLPRRKNIVVSRSMPRTEGVDVCRTLEEALASAAACGKEIFICGGEDIYRQTLPLADRMILSIVDRECDGDAHFPEFDETGWIVTKKDVHPEFVVLYYERKT